MKKWTRGLGPCGILIGVSFGIAYVADRRLGVVAPWGRLLAPVFVRELRPSRPRQRNRWAEGFVHSIVPRPSHRTCEWQRQSSAGPRQRCLTGTHSRRRVVPVPTRT